MVRNKLILHKLDSRPVAPSIILWWVQILSYISWWMEKGVKKSEVSSCAVQNLSQKQCFNGGSEEK